MCIHNTKVNILLTVSYFKLCELTNVTDDYISVAANYRNGNLILSEIEEKLCNANLLVYCVYGLNKRFGV